MLVQELPLSQLRLDPWNPRIVATPRPEGQLDLLASVWEGGAVSSIVRDMLDGGYVGPAAMLGVWQGSGVTIVDGNRRLAALKVAYTQKGWDAINAEDEFNGRLVHGKRIHPREGMDAPLGGDPAQGVILMHSWDDAHRLQIKRHQADRTHWGWLATALDARRMQNNGMTVDEVTDVYMPGDSRQKISWTVYIAKLLTGLNVRDQVDPYGELLSSVGVHQFSVEYQFTALVRALSLPNIRQHLGLGDESGEVLSLKRDSWGAASTLMEQICGKDRVVHSTGEGSADLKRLDDVYGDQKALSRLLEHPNYGLDAVWNRMQGHESTWDTKQRLESLHGAGVRLMGELKDEQEDLIPDANSLNVSHASFTLNNDGSGQYTLHLLGDDCSHGGVSVHMARRLKGVGFPDCVVQLHRELLENYGRGDT